MEFATTLKGVTDRSGEKAAEMKAEVTRVIPFETAIAAQVEQQNNGHYLTQGQTAEPEARLFFRPPADYGPCNRLQESYKSHRHRIRQLRPTFLS